MTTTTIFREINPELAGKLAQAAKQQGSDISTVISMLRNGTPIKAMAASTLLAGFQHAAKIWAGHIVLGLDEPASLLTPQPGSDVRSTARKVAEEVETWLHEKRLVAGREVHLVELTQAQQQHFNQIIKELLRLTQ